MFLNFLSLQIFLVGQFHFPRVVHWFTLSIISIYKIYDILLETSYILSVINEIITQSKFVILT